MRPDLELLGVTLAAVNKSQCLGFGISVVKHNMRIQIFMAQSIVQVRASDRRWDNVRWASLT